MNVKAGANLIDKSDRNTEFPREFPSGLRTQSEVPDLRCRQLQVALPPLIGMDVVLAARQPFQILVSIICAVAVNVIDLMLRRRRWADKGICHDAMHVTLPTASQALCLIASRASTRREQANTPESPQVADFIASLPVHRSPFLSLNRYEGPKPVSHMFIIPLMEQTDNAFSD